MRTSVLLVTAAISVATSTAANAAEPSPLTSSSYTTEEFTSPGPSTWIVPTGVYFIKVDLYGAQGGDGQNPSPDTPSSGGKGGRTTASLSVVPGQELQINVGGKGDSGGGGGSWSGRGGYNGGGDSRSYAGGGGGASDIRTGKHTWNDRILVAGGGGGGGSYRLGAANGKNSGGAGGGEAGASGEGEALRCDPNKYSSAGSGGSKDAGGKGGYWTCDADTWDGDFGNGGGGGFNAGGGGGGWFGGGGGVVLHSTTTQLGGGGGGGSGHASAKAIDPSFATGVQPGNGKVTISYYK